MNEANAFLRPSDPRPLDTAPLDKATRRPPAPIHTACICILPGTVTGSIHITEAALASLIGLTAHEIPGVVGMAPANLKEGLSRVLGRANVSDGVVISKDPQGGLSADLYIVAAYGVSIPTVARNIVDRVAHTVRGQAGIELKATRVHAVGVQRA